MLFALIIYARLAPPRCYAARLARLRRYVAAVHYVAIADVAYSNTALYIVTMLICLFSPSTIAAFAPLIRRYADTLMVARDDGCRLR